MTVGEATRIATARNGKPLEDDWELAMAAAVMFEALAGVAEFCRSEIAAAQRMIHEDRNLGDCDGVEMRARAVRATLRQVEKIITG